MTSPARRLAAWRKDLARVEAELVGINTEKLVLESQREMLRQAIERLQSAADSSTIRSGMVNGIATDGMSKSRILSVKNTKRTHPAKVALVRAGVTDKALAAKLGVSRSTVSSWFAKPPGLRAIPRKHAERLLAEYGIPLDSWQRRAD